MLVPKIKKIVESDGVYVERVLPNPGTIYAKVGDELKPFDHLGNCNVSHTEMKLPRKFKPAKLKNEQQYYQFGAILGKLGKEVITASFNGYLSRIKETGEYLFREVESKYTLLSGVWGKIDKIKESYSVLLKTQTIDVHLVASTDSEFSGELIVFPNPWHSLEKYYLNEFVAGAGNKVIYVGNTVNVELLKEAQKLGVGGIISGSCDKETFDFARARGMNFGIFSGYGNLETPSVIFDYLKTVSNRFVLFQGEQNRLRIPTPDKMSGKETKESAFVELENGSKVLLLEKNYFGQVGVVDNVTESSIFVRLPKVKNLVEIRVPNFLALG